MNTAVLNRKGEKVAEEFVTSVDFDVDAFIPPDYILNEIQKLDTYKRIADLKSDDEIKEMRGELKDRFGMIPDSVDNLLSIAAIRIAANALFVSEIKGRYGEIKLTFKPDADIKVANIDALLKQHSKSLRLENYTVPTFVYYYTPTGEVLSDEKKLLETAAYILKEMSGFLL